MKRLFLLLFLLPISTHASLECEGSAFGLDSVYTFTSTSSKDLAISKATYMDGEVITENSGTAKYSSTVQSQAFGVLESYYVFAPDVNSYTEVIAISKDLKSMGRSRPTPDSDAGNFTKLNCSGSL